MLKIDKLKKQYKNFTLNCSMEVKEGMITGFVGPNGSGKSTTLKAVLGLIYIDGIDIKEAEEPQQIIRQKVKTIGIAGTIPRIGTTTTSLQLVKYIESRGYNAAYVEINTLKYIEQCEKLYADVKRDNIKLINPSF